jgi:hypothetical protein
VKERAVEALAEALLPIPSDLAALSRDCLPSHALRPYQLPPARAIAESIRRRQSRQFAIAFSRQAGKDELLAQLLAWLLIAYALEGGNAVIAAPTFSPQAALSRDRLMDRLGRILPPGVAKQREGYIVEVGRASARFVSAQKEANVRGQTADLLLVANEAQDIKPEVWDAVFDPMAASTNATTLFLGTVWSKQTLLARQMRFLEERQHELGRQLVWRVRWEEVAEQLPAYGERVRARIAQFGERHPFIRTEYCLEELDGDEGLFPPRRLALMQGEHPRLHAAPPGGRGRYALLIDVAGEEEGGTGPAAFASLSRRDSTALTVVEIDDAPGRLPIYRVVDRMAWTGAKHAELHDQIVHLARNVWRASRIVIDATGIGGGLASFLRKTLAERQASPAIRVEPFVFTQSSKSLLGWDFIGLIETGRYREYRETAPPGSPDARITDQFWAQLRAITFEVADGPGQLLSWSVPAGQGHDDLVMSAALVARLETMDMRRRLAIGHSRPEE